MEQQTAVSWLVEMLYSPVCNGFINGNRRVIPHDIIEQAKQMEKKEKVNAQMDMFHFINNLPYGIDYLNKRDKAEKFTKQYGKNNVS